MSNPIEAIVKKFGGVSMLSRLLKHEYPTTVQGWKTKGWVPSQQIPKVIAVAKQEGIKLTYREFFEVVEEVEAS